MLPAGFYSFRITARAFGNTINTIGLWELYVMDAGLPYVGNHGYWPPLNRGVLSAGGSDSGSGGSTPSVTTYTKTYNATSSKWWKGINADELGGTGPELQFGNIISATNGRRKTAVLFPQSTIQADLLNATVTKVEVYLYLASGGSGNNVSIGTHTDSTLPTNYANLAGKFTDRQLSTGWDQGTGRWVNLLFDIQGWKTQYGGIMVGPSVSDSNFFAGSHYGSGHVKGSKLRLTYTK
jgi:hypothetical protein